MQRADEDHRMRFGLGGIWSEGVVAHRPAEAPAFDEDPDAADDRHESDQNPPG